MVQHYTIHRLLYPHCPHSFFQVCGKVVRTKGNLDKHMVQHDRVKPYVCEICGKTFSAKQHLDSHVRLHTGERPYKCSFAVINFIALNYILVKIRNAAFVV